ncbi:MAG TPA: DUF3995 domain-containing protein, partial [Solirubrobacteraceae bacterium]
MDASAPAGPSPQWVRARRAALVAGVVGLLYAGISAYWGLGGTWLLDTVGGSLEREGRSADALLIIAVWAAVVLKLIAVLLPWLVVCGLVKVGWERVARVLAWIEAGILTVYGLVLSAVDLLAEAGVLHASAHADRRALAWHAYLWDPWFLLWGLLVVAALAMARPAV